MDVQAGVGYGIVVDGFAGRFGTYEITISSSQVLHAARATLSNVLQFVLACHSSSWDSAQGMWCVDSSKLLYFAQTTIQTSPTRLAFTVTIAADTGVCVLQGTVKGSVPPPLYGENGRLTLATSLAVPTDQTPYTPSSFSGLNPVPSAPDPAYSPNANFSSGQASSPSPPLYPSPLQGSTPLPIGPAKAQLTGGAGSGIGQPGQPTSDQSGGWTAQGAGSSSGGTGPAPVFVIPPGYLRRQGGVDALPAQHQPGQTPAPAARASFVQALKEAPTPPLSPSQVSFDSASLARAPALPPAGPTSGSTAAASQPSKAAKGTASPRASPSLMPQSPGGSAPQSIPGLQEHSRSSVYKPESRDSSRVTTQDIETSGRHACTFSCLE